MAIKKKRILYLLHAEPDGSSGTTTRSMGTIISLAEAGYTIDLCYSKPASKKMASFFIHKRVYSNIYYRPEKRQINVVLLKKILKFLQLYTPVHCITMYTKGLEDLYQQLQKDNSYDLVLHEGFTSLQFAKKYGEKNIYIDDENMIEIFYERYRQEKNIIKKIYYLFENLLAKRYRNHYSSYFSQFWAISQENKKEVEQSYSLRSFVMPTVVPTEKSAFDSTSTNIVYSATLNWDENIRGIRWFLDNCWKKIQNNTIKTNLIICGKGASDELISYFNSHQNVIYKGFVPDLKKIYKDCALAISPMLVNKGIKMKVLTYMKYGIPVVSLYSGAGGIPNKSGIIRSSKEKYASTITRLLGNKNALKILSHYASLSIRNNYSKEKLVEFVERRIPS